MQKYRKNKYTLAPSHIYFKKYMYVLYVTKNGNKL